MNQVPNAADFVIEIPGEPVGKGVPRARIIVARSGRSFPKIYPDPETASAETVMRELAALAMRGRNPIQSAVRVRVVAHFSVPMSWSLKRQQRALDGIERPVVKPDWDNIAKMLDAFKGIVWADDKLVVSGQVEKIYASRPRTVIEVWEQKGLLL